MQVCKLNKSLYGLKQASREWNTELSKVTNFVYTQSDNGHCLINKRNKAGSTYLLVYVDDILVTGSNPKEIEELKSYLNTEFSIKI